MRIDYDCMFEEKNACCAGFAAFFLTNSIFLFVVVALFQFFHPVINWSPGTARWCSHQVAGTSVVPFTLYSLFTLLLKALVSPSDFRVCVCVCMCERYERYLIFTQKHRKDHCNMMRREISWNLAVCCHICGGITDTQRHPLKRREKNLPED